ncbi:hypothetical protein LPB85_13035 [Chryseobacterium sp. LC2016-27]|uniref:hypothetical protein n=1 Tax=Chryseobacterium sp. LC2016-27 TaxID=2897326 RepID=UPI001E33ADEE|nr:hypothetical protein [Chryseobacterium sp. LC2016-27]MCD0456363.1 hypothetical protein [Chryseobacterium sp. LC2016-27]
MSISYYDFNNLSKESQIELVMAEGKIIDETIKNNLRFVIYELFSFSVEIVYNIDRNKIAGLSAFPGKGPHEK